MPIDEHDLDEDGEHDEDQCELCVERNHTVACDCRCGNCCEALIIEVSLRDGEREPLPSAPPASIGSPSEATPAGQPPTSSPQGDTARDAADQAHGSGSGTATMPANPPDLTVIPVVVPVVLTVSSPTPEPEPPGPEPSEGNDDDLDLRLRRIIEANNEAINE